MSALDNSSPLTADMFYGQPPSLIFAIARSRELQQGKSSSKGCRPVYFLRDIMASAQGPIGKPEQQLFREHWAGGPNKSGEFLW